VRRPGTIAGVVALIILGYITYNSVVTEGPGSRGVEAGTELPAFAVPLASSDLEGDANVSDRACEVRSEDVLNVCELAERGPAVIAFFAEPVARCVDQVEMLDGLQRRFSDVQFAAVAIRGDRDDLRRLVSDRDWGLPVGHDRDGAVANVYAVAVCPQITFVRRGGEVTGTAFGTQDEAELVERIEEL
jgi:hypothetical protein